MRGCLSPRLITLAFTNLANAIGHIFRRTKYSNNNNNTPPPSHLLPFSTSRKPFSAAPPTIINVRKGSKGLTKADARAGLRAKRSITDSPAWTRHFELEIPSRDSSTRSTSGPLLRIGRTFDRADSPNRIRRTNISPSRKRYQSPARQNQWRYQLEVLVEESDAELSQQLTAAGSTLLEDIFDAMSSTAMQAVAQQNPVSLPQTPQRRYHQQQPQSQPPQQSPQNREPFYDQQSPQFLSSPETSRRPSQRPTGNSNSAANSTTPQQLQYRSSNGSDLPSSRGQQPTLSSPQPPVTAPSPTTHLPRREVQDQLGGPPIPPPPRTSSHQRGQNTTSASSVLSTETNPGSRKPNRVADDRPTSSRIVHTGDGRERNDIERVYGGEYISGSDRERAKDDTATAAAAAARSRRRGPQSPDEPKRSGSTKQVRGQQSPSTVQSRSAAAVGTGSPASNTALTREGSTVINRVVVTDPRVDIIRERERLAEAQPGSLGSDLTPVTGLGLVGSEGVDDGGRGGSKTRQDYSSSASRRKETRFGEYVLGQTLGEGEFGKVKLGWKKDGSVQVAIKLIRRESLGTNPSRLPKIYREISILRELSHPNIVRLHEMVETDRHIGIILEYASGGELFDYILNHRYLKDNAARRLFAQLVSGVGYLHKKGIVHRDLKLENLLLDRNRNIIITDFGFANTFDPSDELGDEIEYNLANRDFVKKLDLEHVRDNGSRRGDLMQTSCGSPCYAAPELVVSDSLYTGRKVDVWSCGVILYAMLAGYLPFDDDPANPEGDNINLLYKYIVSTPLTFPEYVTPHARDLLRRILVPDPRKRADLFEVARHSWLSEYANVVAHVTSSTTTVGDIANATVTTEDHPEAPLLARSASVREPTKPYPSNLSPVGGLNHQQGKIDPYQQGEKPKTQRDAKRRTVQVEYVAPQSQTVRGEPGPSPVSGITAGSPPAADVGMGSSRARAGSQGVANAPQKKSAGGTPSGSRPHPMDPQIIQGSRPLQTYEVAAVQGKGQQRPPSSHQGMPPPPRPGREVPRSVSESTGAFGSQTTAPTMTRPDTGGSTGSTGNGRYEMRLPSRGSYGQPVAPAVAVTTAQGSLAQPRSSKQYIISSPIPQQGLDTSQASIGKPSTEQMSPRYDPRPSAPNQPPRGHKRSNTVGGIGEKIFGRSNSIFGGKQAAEGQGQQQPERKYPPVSMANTGASDAPRQSTDSRRSTSFGFGRKASDLSKGDKPRRFSLLPASFSLKGFASGNKDQSSVDNLTTERKSYAKPPGSRGQSRPMAFGQGQSRSNSYSTEESVAVGFERQQERMRAVPPQQSSRTSVPLGNASQSQQPNVTNKSSSQQGGHGGRAPYQSQYYRQAESVAPTESESSLTPAPYRPNYPPGFNSYEDPPRPSTQQARTGRGAGVLQKNTRKFADAYEQDQEPGYGAGGQHAGSSGAARKVMDFFRRRGKARAAPDR